MRFASFDMFGLSTWRMVALALASSIFVGIAVGFAVGDALGQAKIATLLVIATLVFYITVSSPRRLLDQQRVAQARESLLLTASAQACMMVTGSRSKTFMLIRAKEQALRVAVKQAGRMILLGNRVSVAAEACSRGIASYSAAVALQSVATTNAREFTGGDEESRGLATASELSMETKLPMFMTLCFFTPIMIVLYAVFSHSYQQEQMVELGAFEFAVIDIGYYLSAAERNLW
ncbi:MAG TPA: hypothetical protein VEJ19_05340 [Nitrososphaerales archaeon]|nr:hypothetical protein [Nitrososphaerales archaeon]